MSAPRPPSPESTQQPAHPTGRPQSPGTEGVARPIPHHRVHLAAAAADGAPRPPSPESTAQHAHPAGLPQPPGTEAVPKKTPYRVHLAAAEAAFASKVPPLVAVTPRGHESSSAYAHLRSQSATLHERRARTLVATDPHAAYTEYRQATQSREAELKTKVDDQRAFTPGTPDYKQHQHYIDTEVSPAVMRTRAAGKGVKDDTVKAHANHLRDHS